MAFYCNSYVFCPECPPRFNRRGDRVGAHLDCVEHNYSGCAVDIGECTVCGKLFEIAYQVKSIKQVGSVHAEYQTGG